MINTFGEFVQRYGRPEFNAPAGTSDADDYFTEDEYAHSGEYCKVCKKRVYFLWVHKRKHEAVIDKAA